MTKHAMVLLCGLVGCSSAAQILEPQPRDGGATSPVDGGGVPDAGGLQDAGAHPDAGWPDAGPAAFFDDGGTPAWAVGAPLNAFIAIPGSSGPGVVCDAYSGFTLREDTSEIFFLAVGGHGDSSDNRVVSLSLLADAPRWVLRNPPSTHPIPNAGYYDDGIAGQNLKPGSTHTYDYTAWIPQAAGGAGRLMRFGMHGLWPTGGDAYNVDGFDPVTNQWDPPGTYPDTHGTAGTARDGATGEVYAAGGAWKLAPGGSAWVAVNGIRTVRFPNAYDSKRHAFFGLQFGDGQGYPPSVVTAQLADLTAQTTTPITFNPGPALTQFNADQPTYAAMGYDPLHDRYLFYAATSNATQPATNVPDRIYVVTPNATTTWDLDFFPLAPGGVIPANAPASGSGINGRFKYVPRLKGFVLLPSQSATLYFLRTG